MNAQKKRHSYLIYPKFQLTLVFFNIIIILGIITPVIVSIYFSFNKLHEMGVQAHIQEGHVYYKFLKLQFSVIFTSLLVALFFGILISILFSIFVSHRVAGPIVRMKGFFRQISETGQVSSIQFRKGDFFTEIPDEINRALDKIKSKT